MIKRFAVMGEREARVVADACAIAKKAAERVRHHADPRHLVKVAFGELESAFREVERGETILLGLAQGHGGPRRVKWNQDLMNAIAEWVKDNPPPMLVGLVNEESADTLQETPRAKAHVDPARNYNCMSCGLTFEQCMAVKGGCCAVCFHNPERRLQEDSAEGTPRPAEPAPLPRSERSNSSDELRSESSHKSPK